MTTRRHPQRQEHEGVDDAQSTVGEQGNPIVEPSGGKSALAVPREAKSQGRRSAVALPSPRPPHRREVRRSVSRTASREESPAAGDDGAVEAHLPDGRAR
jgi:hypothetical protein